MSTWKVARLGRTCALSGRPLPPDTAVLAALFGEAEEVSEDKVRGVGLVRKDYLVDEVPEGDLARAVEGAYCTWRTRTPPENPSHQHRLDLGLARELLDRMRASPDPERAPVQLALALLLVRKRQLHLVSEQEGLLTLRWPKTDDTFTIPAVTVSDAEEAQIQLELQRLFEF
ncbi:MAG TPA: hypothetical protein VND21_05105 [Planctomycetota bacterium]|nr:hypothetical protein [Planctomycetota bacterium]